MAFIGFLPDASASLVVFWYIPTTWGALDTVLVLFSSRGTSSGHSSHGTSSGHSSRGTSSGHSSRGTSSGHSSGGTSSGHSSRGTSSGHSSGGTYSEHSSREVKVVSSLGNSSQSMSSRRLEENKHVDLFSVQWRNQAWLPWFPKKQGKSEGFDSCDRPSNLKLDSNRQFFRPCDREIWWMTLQNNRAPLLCYFKLCASFPTHWWIQTWVTVRKRSIRVKIDNFFSCVT